jgi:16S rRNA (adenine1518-N6/adenine1519-N6)-dimethyltransferase
MGSRRKTLANALARGLGLAPGEARALIEEARLEPGRRGETLSIAEFLALARVWLARARTERRG